MDSLFTVLAPLVGGACFLGMVFFSLLLMMNALNHLPALLRLKWRMERTLRSVR